MSVKNINKFKSELNQIRLGKDRLNNYTLFEYSDRNPDKENYNKLINNAISDLYLLTDELKLNVLKDFWIEEGRFFEYYDIARRCRNYAIENDSQMDFYSSFIYLFNRFFKPKIEVNSKNLDSNFLYDLPALLLEKRGAICRFIYEVKTKYFPNTFIDFLSVAKTSESIGHMIREIEVIKKCDNQFVVKQLSDIQKENRGCGLVELLENMSSYERHEYFLNIIQPVIFKDSLIDNCDSREEAIRNSQRNAALLFNVDISEIVDTKYGLMPQNVFETLFKKYDVEYNIVRNERNAKMVWVDKIKPDIDKKISNCNIAKMPINDVVEAFKAEYSHSYGKYKNDPDNIKWEKICFDKFIEPYLDGLINVKHQNAFLPQQQENPLIFEKSILDNFHGAFNDYLWESTDIESYKNWFRVKPIGVPIFKKDMKFYFCYAIGKIEEKRNMEICPNMGKWITQLIGNTNHSSLKKKATDKTKKSVINEKFNLFT